MNKALARSRGRTSRAWTCRPRAVPVVRTYPAAERLMTDRILDVVGIGNAIVDIISQTDDSVIAALGLNKGAMTLIDTARADHLYGQMGPAIEASGGSAGNTIAGVASLGGRGAFIGKVSNDQFGGVFRHDIRSSGVTFETA